MAPREPFDRDPAHADGAERPFPDEAHWLTLPPPAELPAPGFVDRVVRALAEDRALDADLATLARELPRSLLETWRAPVPAPDFVARTVAAVEDERRTRWQKLLARHVAPEPSPEFVARTLAALRAVDRAHDRAGVPAAAGPGPGPGAGDRAQPRSWPRLLAWPLAAAAAAALWFASGSTPAEPALEARLADAAPRAYAHAYAASPTAAVLASHLRTSEPDAVFTTAADGVWLSLGGAR